LYSFVRLESHSGWSNVWVLEMSFLSGLELAHLLCTSHLLSDSQHPDWVLPFASSNVTRTQDEGFSWIVSPKFWAYYSSPNLHSVSEAIKLVGSNGS
jgi:hypothetical protein